MIRHKADTISIRQYAKFESTKKYFHLYKIWLPEYFAIKYATPFIEEFNSLFNENNNSDIDKLGYKLLAQNKIMLFQALMLGIQVHLGEKVQLEMLKGKNHGYFKDEKFAYYISEIEQAAGIKIEKVEDIIAFRDELERKIDKYNELYPEQKEPTESVSIIQLAFSIFAILNMPYDGNMKLSELAVLKKLANERAKQQQAQIDKYKQ